MHINKSILESILEENFGDRILKNGNEWVIPSFLKPSKLKCYVNVEKGTAVDFIGGHGYSARLLIAEIMGLEGNTEIDRFISDYTMRHIRSINTAEMMVNRKKQKPSTPPPVSVIDLPPTMDLLGTGKFITRIRGYLYERGLTDKDIVKYHLSYCGKGEFAGRIIIPFIEENEIVWFQARAINKKAFLRYINPKNVKKSMIVYNIDAIKERAVITEGPFDAMTINGQAIMASAMSEWQAYKICQKEPEEIILVPDNDFSKSLGISPGYVGMLRSIERLIEQKYPLEKIKIVEVVGGKDLNEVGKETAMKIIENGKQLTFGMLVKFKEFGANSKLLDKMI